MQPEAAKFLYDIKHAAELLVEFTRDKIFDDYKDQPMLRATVERQFEIIGEALSRLSKRDKDTADKITDHQRLIAF